MDSHGDKKSKKNIKSEKALQAAAALSKTPVQSHQTTLRNLLENPGGYQCLICEANTGSGKSTLLPQFCADYCCNTGVRRQGQEAYMSPFFEQDAHNGHPASISYPNLPIPQFDDNTDTWTNQYDLIKNLSKNKDGSLLLPSNVDFKNARHPLTVISQPSVFAAFSVATFLARTYEARYVDNFVEHDDYGYIGHRVGYISEDVCLVNLSTAHIIVVVDSAFVRILSKTATSSEHPLPGVNIIIIDEAHERTLSSDVIMSLAKDIMRKRDEVRVIIASATISAEAFVRFMYDLPPDSEIPKKTLLKIAGRNYAVEKFYSPVRLIDYDNAEIEDDYFDEIIIPKLFEMIGLYCHNDRNDAMIFVQDAQQVHKLFSILTEKLDPSKGYQLPLTETQIEQTKKWDNFHARYSDFLARKERRRLSRQSNRAGYNNYDDYDDYNNNNNIRSPRFYNNNDDNGIQNNSGDNDDDDDEIDPFSYDENGNVIPEDLNGVELVQPEPRKIVTLNDLKLVELYTGMSQRSIHDVITTAKDFHDVRNEILLLKRRQRMYNKAKEAHNIWQQEMDALSVECGGNQYLIDQAIADEQAHVDSKNATADVGFGSRREQQFVSRYTEPKIIEFVDQDRLSELPKQHKKTIYIADSIGETSITLPDVTLVIDTGRIISERFDVNRRVTVQETIYLSRDRANQRRGRAGRTQGGRCVRLYQKDALINKHTIAEIQRVALDKVVLMLCKMNLDIAQLRLVDQPEARMLAFAVDQLLRYKCIEENSLFNNNNNGDIRVPQYVVTDKGGLFLDLPYEPDVSQMLYSGFQLDELSKIQSIASTTGQNIGQIDTRSIITKTSNLNLIHQSIHLTKNNVWKITSGDTIKMFNLWIRRQATNDYTPPHDPMFKHHNQMNYNQSSSKNSSNKKNMFSTVLNDGLLYSIRSQSDLIFIFFVYRIFLTFHYTNCPHYDTLEDTLTQEKISLDTLLSRESYLQSRQAHLKRYGLWCQREIPSNSTGKDHQISQQKYYDAGFCRCKELFCGEFQLEFDALCIANESITLTREPLVLFSEHACNSTLTFSTDRAGEPYKAYPVKATTLTDTLHHLNKTLPFVLFLSLPHRVGTPILPRSLHSGGLVLSYPWIGRIKAHIAKASVVSYFAPSSTEDKKSKTTQKKKKKKKQTSTTTTTTTTTATSNNNDDNDGDDESTYAPAIDGLISLRIAQCGHEYQVNNIHPCSDRSLFTAAMKEDFDKVLNQLTIQDCALVLAVGPKIWNHVSNELYNEAKADLKDQSERYEQQANLNKQSDALGDDIQKILQRQQEASLMIDTKRIWARFIGVSVRSTSIGCAVVIRNLNEYTKKCLEFIQEKIRTAPLLNDAEYCKFIFSGDKLYTVVIDPFFVPRCIQLHNPTNISSAQYHNDVKALVLSSPRSQDDNNDTNDHSIRYDPLINANDPIKFYQMFNDMIDDDDNNNNNNSNGTKRTKWLCHHKTIRDQQNTLFRLNEAHSRAPRGAPTAQSLESEYNTISPVLNSRHGILNSNNDQIFLSAHFCNFVSFPQGFPTKKEMVSFKQNLERFEQMKSILREIRQSLETDIKFLEHMQHIIQYSHLKRFLEQLDVIGSNHHPPPMYSHFQSIIKAYHQYFDFYHLDVTDDVRQENIEQRQRQDPLPLASIKKVKPQKTKKTKKKDSWFSFLGMNNNDDDDDDDNHDDNHDDEANNNVTAPYEFEPFYHYHRKPGPPGTQAAFLELEDKYNELEDLLTMSDDEGDDDDDNNNNFVNEWSYKHVDFTDKVTFYHLEYTLLQLFNHFQQANQMPILPEFNQNLTQSLHTINPNLAKIQSGLIQAVVDHSYGLIAVEFDDDSEQLHDLGYNISQMLPGYDQDHHQFVYPLTASQIKAIVKRNKEYQGAIPLFYITTEDNQSLELTDSHQRYISSLFSSPSQLTADIDYLNGTSRRQTYFQPHTPSQTSLYKTTFNRHSTEFKQIDINDIQYGLFHPRCHLHTVGSDINSQNNNNNNNNNNGKHTAYFFVKTHRDLLFFHQQLVKRSYSHKISIQLEYGITLSLPSAASLLHITPFQYNITPSKSNFKHLTELYPDTTIISTKSTPMSPRTKHSIKNQSNIMMNGSTTTTTTTSGHSGNGNDDDVHFFRYLPISTDSFHSILSVPISPFQLLTDTATRNMDNYTKQQKHATKRTLHRWKPFFEQYYPNHISKFYMKPPPSHLIDLYQDRDMKMNFFEHCRADLKPENEAIVSQVESFIKDPTVDAYHNLTPDVIKFLTMIPKRVETRLDIRSFDISNIQMDNIKTMLCQPIVYFGDNIALSMAESPSIVAPQQRFVDEMNNFAKDYGYIFERNELPHDFQPKYPFIQIPDPIETYLSLSNTNDSSSHPLGTLLDFMKPNELGEKADQFEIDSLATVKMVNKLANSRRNAKKYYQNDQALFETILDQNDNTWEQYADDLPSTIAVLKNKDLKHLKTKFGSHFNKNVTHYPGHLFLDPDIDGLYLKHSFHLRRRMDQFNYYWSGAVQHFNDLFFIQDDEDDDNNRNDDDNNNIIAPLSSGTNKLVAKNNQNSTLTCPLNLKSAFIAFHSKKLIIYHSELYDLDQIINNALTHYNTTLKSNKVYEFMDVKNDNNTTKNNNSNRTDQNIMTDGSSQDEIGCPVYLDYAVTVQHNKEYNKSLFKHNFGLNSISDIDTTSMTYSTTTILLKSTHLPSLLHIHRLLHRMFQPTVVQLGPLISDFSWTVKRLFETKEIQKLGLSKVDDNKQGKNKNYNNKDLLVADFVSCAYDSSKTSDLNNISHTGGYFQSDQSHQRQYSHDNVQGGATRHYIGSQNMNSNYDRHSYNQQQRSKTFASGDALLIVYGHQTNVDKLIEDVKVNIPKYSSLRRLYKHLPPTVTSSSNAYDMIKTIADQAWRDNQVSIKFSFPHEALQISHENSPDLVAKAATAVDNLLQSFGTSAVRDLSCALCQRSSKNDNNNSTTTTTTVGVTMCVIPKCDHVVCQECLWQWVHSKLNTWYATKEYLFRRDCYRLFTQSIAFFNVNHCDTKGKTQNLIPVDGVEQQLLFLSSLQQFIREHPDNQSNQAQPINPFQYPIQKGFTDENNTNTNFSCFSITCPMMKDKPEERDERLKQSLKDSLDKHDDLSVDSLVVLENVACCNQQLTLYELYTIFDHEYWGRLLRYIVSEFIHPSIYLQQLKQSNDNSNSLVQKSFYENFKKLIPKLSHFNTISDSTAKQQLLYANDLLIHPDATYVLEQSQTHCSMEEKRLDVLKSKQEQLAEIVKTKQYIDKAATNRGAMFVPSEITDTHVPVFTYAYDANESRRRQVEAQKKNHSASLIKYYATTITKYNVIDKLVECPSCQHLATFVNHYTTCSACGNGHCHACNVGNNDLHLLFHDCFMFQYVKFFFSLHTNAIDILLKHINIPDNIIKHLEEYGLDQSIDNILAIQTANFNEQTQWRQKIQDLLIQRANEFVQNNFSSQIANDPHKTFVQTAPKLKHQNTFMAHTPLFARFVNGVMEHLGNKVYPELSNITTTAPSEDVVDIIEPDFEQVYTLLNKFLQLSYVTSASNDLKAKVSQPYWSYHGSGQLDILEKIMNTGLDPSKRGSRVGQRYGAGEYSSLYWRVAGDYSARNLPVLVVLSLTVDVTGNDNSNAHYCLVTNNPSHFHSTYSIPVGYINIQRNDDHTFTPQPTASKEDSLPYIEWRRQQQCIALNKPFTSIDKLQTAMADATKDLEQRLGEAYATATTDSKWYFTMAQPSTGQNNNGKNYTKPSIHYPFDEYMTLSLERLYLAYQCNPRNSDFEVVNWKVELSNGQVVDYEVDFGCFIMTDKNNDELEYDLVRE